jgi:hypothetical protein
MAKDVRLYDLAKVLRSKNAGPFELTLDIMFDDDEKYETVKRSGVITRDLVCRLYRVPPEDVYHVVFFDAARAVKITIRRPVDSGSIGDTDVYGAQQHAPLIDVRIPVAS